MQPTKDCGKLVGDDHCSFNCGSEHNPIEVTLIKTATEVYDRCDTFRKQAHTECAPVIHKVTCYTSSTPRK